MDKAKVESARATAWTILFSSSLGILKLREELIEEIKDCLKLIVNWELTLGRYKKNVQVEIQDLN